MKPKDLGIELEGEFQVINREDDNGRYRNIPFIFPHEPADGENRVIRYYVPSQNEFYSFVAALEFKEDIFIFYSKEYEDEDDYCPSLMFLYSLKEQLEDEEIRMEKEKETFLEDIKKLRKKVYCLKAEIKHLNC